MKLTSLLLSSAAILVAGSAFAADLPAKKAAPAAAVVACPAFGAGFFQLPGSDTCISFSGYVRDDMKFKSVADRADAASATVNENLYSAYSNSASFRLNIDTRSNTEIGVVRGFMRTDGSLMGQAYVQAGGFTFGKAGTWMGNGGGVANGNFGSHTDATQVSYSAAIGGGTVSVGIVDSSANLVKDSSFTNTGVASTPDIMAKISIPVGGATLGLGVVSHETRGNSSGSASGYAVGATLGLSPASGVSVGIEGGYASGALGYLGTAGAATAVSADIAQVGDAVLTAAGVVGDANTGYNVSGYASFAAGKGSINLFAGYTVLSDETANIDVSATSFEIDYAMAVAKGLTITPGVAYISADDGTTSANATVAVIRIQRDF